MNQFFSCITFGLCLLCLFIVVVHADTTEFTEESKTNVEKVSSSSIESQPQAQPQSQKQQQSPQTTNDDSVNNLPSNTLPSSTIVPNNNTGLVEYICHPTGECEPCEVLESKTEKYCDEYGNKEPVECHYVPDDQSSGNVSYPNRGPLPEFRACKRVKRFERTKYFEFQFINFIVAVTSCSILLWRRRKLAEDGYRRLARRIRGNTL